MSSLLINRDSHIMMLEVAVEKLFVPSTSPFDDVITSKFIVSFRFLDDEWIDILPKRPDYKEYQGSVGEDQLFYGGKSVVFSLTESNLVEESEGLAVEVKARREISSYFETENGPVTNLGCVPVDVDDLFNGIVEELRIRDELKDYLHLIHKRDPISKSIKGTYTLQEATGSYLKLYVRLSHLGDCVIAQVDKPYRGPISYFYAQEQSNLASPYECCELEAPGKPRRDLPFPKPLDSCAVECTCTGDQLLFNENANDQDAQDKCDKKKKRKKKKSKGDDCNNKPQKRPTGVITVGIVDKPRPCEPIPHICTPCYSPQICAMKSGDLPCIPILSCLEAICCED